MQSDRANATREHTEKAVAETGIVLQGQETLLELAASLGNTAVARVLLDTGMGLSQQWRKSCPPSEPHDMLRRGRSERHRHPHLTAAGANRLPG